MHALLHRLRRCGGRLTPSAPIAMPSRSSSGGSGTSEPAGRQQRQQDRGTVLPEHSRHQQQQTLRELPGMPSEPSAVRVLPSLSSTLPRPLPRWAAAPTPASRWSGPENAFPAASVPREAPVLPRTTRLVGFSALLAAAEEQGMQLPADHPAGPTAPQLQQPMQQLSQQHSQPPTLLTPTQLLQLPLSRPKVLPALGATSQPQSSNAFMMTTAPGGLSGLRYRFGHGAMLGPSSGARGPLQPAGDATLWRLGVRPSVHNPSTAAPSNRSGLVSLVPSSATPTTGARAAFSTATPRMQPDGLPQGLTLPRLAGLPVSPPGSGDSLGRPPSNQGDSAALVNPIAGAVLPPARVLGTDEGTSTKSKAADQVQGARSAATVGPLPPPPRRLGPPPAQLLPSLPPRRTPPRSQRPSPPRLRYSPPSEHSPAAALSMLADASNEFPMLLLQPGHKRPSQEVVAPVERQEEELSRDERTKRLRSSRTLREISATSARLNPQPVGQALSTGAKQPSKSSVAPGGSMAAASQPFVFGPPTLPALALPGSVGGADRKEQRHLHKVTSHPPVDAGALLPPLAPSPTPWSVPTSSAPKIAQEQTARRLPSHDRALPASSLPLLGTPRPLSAGSVAHGMPRPQGPLPGDSLPPAADVGVTSRARPASQGPRQPDRPELRKVPPDPTAGCSVTRGSLEPSASAGDVQATWYCDRCGRPYKWKQTLQAHRRLCGARSFACDECTERFDTKPQLDMHKRTAHEKRARRYYCWCGLSYENKSNLRRHERETHENHAPAVCEQCGKSYPRKTSLHRHIMEKHKGEKRKEDRSKSDKDKGKNDKHKEKDGKS